MKSAKAVVFFEREPFPTSLAKPSLYFQGNSLLKYLLMTENSKKNKRGAQGSIEDEVNEAKNPFTNSDNMADQENSRAEPTFVRFTKYVGRFTEFRKYYPEGQSKS